MCMAKWLFSRVSRSSLARLMKARSLGANTVNGPSSFSIFARPLDCAAVTKKLREPSASAPLRRSADWRCSCPRANVTNMASTATTLKLFIRLTSKYGPSSVSPLFHRLHDARSLGPVLRVPGILRFNVVQATRKLIGQEVCRSALNLYRCKGKRPDFSKRHNFTIRRRPNTGVECRGERDLLSYDSRIQTRYYGPRRHCFLHYLVESGRRPADKVRVSRISRRDRSCARRLENIVEASDAVAKRGCTECVDARFEGHCPRRRAAKCP